MSTAAVRRNSSSSDNMTQLKKKKGEIHWYSG